MQSQPKKKLHTTFIIVVAVAVFFIALAATMMHLYILSRAVTHELKDKALILARTFDVATQGAEGLPAVEELKRKIFALQGSHKDIYEIEVVARNEKVAGGFEIILSTDESEIGRIPEPWDSDAINANRRYTLLEISDRKARHSVSETPKERIGTTDLLKAMFNPDHLYLWEVIEPLHDSRNHVVGAIVIEISLDRAVARVKRSIVNSFGIFGGSILCMVLIVWFATQKLVVQPLHALGVGIEIVKAGDFTRKLTFDREDEVGQLAENYNEMIDSLQKARAELDELNRSLQDRVEQATAELKKTNQDLTGKIVELQQTQQKLSRSERYTSSALMAAGIAHEIHSPLNAIKLVVQHMQDTFVDKAAGQDPRYLELVRVFDDKVKKLETLVSAFLDYTRPVKPRLAPCRLSELLDTTLVLASAMFQGANITVEKQYMNEIPPVNVDRQMMSRAFMNLFANAYQAMPNGGVLCVKTTLTDDGRTVHLTISDTGVGMEAVQLKQIFDPFYTNKTGGIGLGLPIVQQIIDAHDGRIRVESEAGRGTSVHMELDVPL